MEKYAYKAIEKMDEWIAWFKDASPLKKFIFLAAVIIVLSILAKIF